ncbi:MAG: hypothetical protein AAF483_04560 [Planctomycetota bacterium]
MPFDFQAENHAVEVRTNPFATKFVCGAMPWFGDDLTLLAKELLASRRIGCAIVGPHGTGKSTLLENLAPALGQVRIRLGPEGIAAESNSDGNLVWLQLRRGRAGDLAFSPWECIRQSKPHWCKGGILILDGYEQLYPWQRLRLLIRLQLSGMRLLATSHRHHLALQTILETSVSDSIVHKVIGHLLRYCPEDQAAKEWLHAKAKQALLSHRGNLREALMDLYDCYRDREFLACREHV